LGLGRPGVSFGKKGFFFTFIAIVILMIFIAVYSFDSEDTVYTTLYSGKSQIDVANSFTKDLKDVYLKRVLITSSELAIDSMNNRVYATGKPIDNVSLRFEELIFNGTLYGVKDPLLDDKTLSNWTDKMVTIGDKNFRIKANVSFYSLKVYQTDPWLLTVVLDEYIYVNYSNIIYAVSGQTAANISVVGVDDPLFLMHGQNRTIREYFPKQWNTSTLLVHIKNQTFTDNSWAPSFIMRMENNTGSSECCGIESLMNASYDVNLSYVDYLFWNKTYGCHHPSPSIFRPIFRIEDISYPGSIGEHFKLDEPHLTYYGYHVNDSDVDIICN
jgi:hypothetical protein